MSEPAQPRKPLSLWPEVDAPPPLELTANYKALDRPLDRGSRTPFVWPPRVNHHV